MTRFLWGFAFPFVMGTEEKSIERAVEEYMSKVDEKLVVQRAELEIALNGCKSYTGERLEEQTSRNDEDIPSVDDYIPQGEKKWIAQLHHKYTALKNYSFKTEEEIRSIKERYQELLDSYVQKRWKHMGDVENIQTDYEEAMRKYWKIAQSMHTLKYKGNVPIARFHSQLRNARDEYRFYMKKYVRYESKNKVLSMFSEIEKLLDGRMTSLARERDASMDQEMSMDGLVRTMDLTQKTPIVAGQEEQTLEVPQKDSIMRYLGETTMNLGRNILGLDPDTYLDLGFKPA